MKCFTLFVLLLIGASSMVFASMRDDEYTDLVMTAARTPLFIPDEADVKPSQKAAFETYKNGFLARQLLFSQPLDECIPKLYELWSGTGHTNEVAVLLDLDGNKIEERSFYTAVNIQLNFLSGLYFGFLSQGHIAFLWMKGDLDDPIISDTFYKFYWWYEGRRYLSQIWNNWLECWQQEQSLEKPRKAVEQELVSEITGLGYHIFPYLYNELRLGDKSMIKLLKKLSRPERGSWIFEDFQSWWENNKAHYTFPKPEGYDNVRNKLLLGPLGQDKTMLRAMDRWNINTKKFYADPNSFKENYWYYKIGDKDISSEEISEIKRNLKTE